MPRRLVGPGLVILCIALVSGCGGDKEPAATGARVSIEQPKDESTVSSPVQVVMAAEGLEIGPAGRVDEGAGHFHLMVDTRCVDAGSVIPDDKAHRHFAKGEDVARLGLPVGKHTLCLQAGDGAHVALDATHEININVVERGASVEIWAGTLRAVLDTPTCFGIATGSFDLGVAPNGTVQGGGRSAWGQMRRGCSPFPSARLSVSGTRTRSAFRLVFTVSGPFGSTTPPVTLPIRGRTARAVVERPEAMQTETYVLRCEVC